MDKAILVPFGKIERYMKPRRLGKKEPHARSTIITRWDIILPVISDAINTMPKLRDRLREIVNQRDKEVQVSRGEFEQLDALLGTISDAWTFFLAETRATIRDRLETWHQGSRRGLFRLLVLLAAAVMESQKKQSGKDLSSKGFGGQINNAIKQASNGRIEAKAGSLYIAINDFVSDGFISNYDLDANQPIKVTQKGKAFILASMNILKDFLGLLSNMGLLKTLTQENLAGIKSINDEIFEVATPTVDLAALMKNIAQLPSSIDFITTSPAFKDARDVDVKGMVDSWQDNLNRGIIDMFILGRFFFYPSYGNALIFEAEGVLGIPTGTLYPKLRDLSERGLIMPITDEEKLNLLKQASSKSQGPPKVYYDITSRGALYLLAITSFHLADLTVFLKFTQDLLECVVKPGPVSNSK